MDVAKLEKWVDEHPKEADLVTINMSTGKKFTVRGVLEAVKQEKESGVAIADKDFIEVKNNIAKWLEGV
jgi:hypothetical protein